MKPTLGDLEQLVLLAVLQLGDDAYGVSVQREIARRAQRDVALGAVYSALTRLEAKGFVRTRVGAPVAERGGRRKKMYIVQAAGREAVRDAMRALRALSQGLAPAFGLR